jgi:hypothetical protein
MMNSAFSRIHHFDIKKPGLQSPGIFIAAKRLQTA